MVMNTEPTTAIADAPAEVPRVADAGDASLSAGIGRYRWVICALLFTAATINYVDRQVLGVLKTTLQKELGYNDIDYGNIVTSFQAAYAIGMLTMGRLMDRIGTRRGFSFAVGFWSLAAAAHALVGSAGGLSAARFALGIGEAGMFPGALKTIAEWFPKKERALATGLFNSGTNIGAIVCPLVVPWIAVSWGWRATEPSPAPGKVGWLSLIPHRQTWAFAIGKFMTDPFWWLYLFWVPDFLNRKHGLNLLQIGPPLVTIYLLSDVGSIAGGWFSSMLMRRGWTANAARKTAMLACALGVAPVFLATRTDSLWVAVLLLGLATAAHQGFSANLFTLTTDMFPSQAVGSAVGFGGMAGAIGGMLIAQIAGRVLQLTGSYSTLFIMAASAYVLALAIIHALVPRLEPARLKQG
jgi:ACS family hexuronate transporter-like MFS transporter